MNVALPEYAKLFFEPLERAGHAVYLVGGAVRDALQAVPCRDLDFATSATPRQVCDLFSSAKVGKEGISHGGVTVCLADGVSAEITTFRTEGAYSDGRHPDSVTFVKTLEEDLPRRDFTVCAMALSSDGELIDPFGGREDLKCGVLRTVGDAHRRFAEDKLRVLRALRFCSEHGFVLEKTCRAAMQEQGAALSQLPRPACFSEVCRLLCGKDAERVLVEERELILAFLPEFEQTVGLDCDGSFQELDVYHHTARVVGRVEGKCEVRLAAFLHDLGKTQHSEQPGFGGHAATSARMALAFLQSFSAPRALALRVAALVRASEGWPQDGVCGVQRLLLELGEEELLQKLLMLKRANVSAKGPLGRELGEIRLLALAEDVDAFFKEKEAFAPLTLPICKRDLLAFGVPDTEEVGDILQAVHACVVRGELKAERETLLSAARKIFETQNRCIPF